MQCYTVERKQDRDDSMDGLPRAESKEAFTCWTGQTYSWVDLDKQPKSDTSLRHVQLEVRKTELEQVISAVKANKYRRPACPEGAGIRRLGPA
ncbi:hypothetical protein BDR05DRAFT_486180 [Suillus weaverae]|nr:hypothetical protein BDR05DRAFT_486180 [Suillus weaverae]